MSHVHNDTTDRGDKMHAKAKGKEGAKKFSPKLPLVTE